MACCSNIRWAIITSISSFLEYVLCTEEQAEMLIVLLGSYTTNHTVHKPLFSKMWTVMNCHNMSMAINRVLHGWLNVEFGIQRWNFDLSVRFQRPAFHGLCDRQGDSSRSYLRVYTAKYLSPHKVDFIVHILFRNLYIEVLASMLFIDSIIFKEQYRHLSQ